MKKYLSPIQVFTFLMLLLSALPATGTVKENVPIAVDHPKLIKTIGDPRYGNVNCSLQDKASNLWFGTTKMGFTNTMGNRLRLIRNISTSLFLARHGVVQKAGFGVPNMVLS